MILLENSKRYFVIIFVLNILPYYIFTNNTRFTDDRFCHIDVACY